MTFNQIKSKVLAHFELANLYFVQIFLIVVPLLTIPVLISSIGIDAYGRYAAIQVFHGFFLIFVEFGFGWSAVRWLAEFKPGEAPFDKMVSDILWTQLLLGFFAFISSGVLSYFSFGLKLDVIDVLIFNLQFFAYALTVPWLLLFLQKSKILSAFHLLNKGTFLLLIYTLSSENLSLHKTVVLTAICSVFYSVVVFVYILKKYNISLYPASLVSIVKLLKNGFSIFKIRGYSSVYQNALPLVVSQITESNDFAFFSIVDKLRRATISLTTPLFQYSYVRVFRHKVNDSHISAKSYLLILLVGFILSLMHLIAVYIFANYLKMHVSHVVLFFVLISSISIPMVCISNYIAQLLLIPSGLERDVEISSLFGGLIGISSLLILSNFVDALSAAFFAIALVETLIAAYLYSRKDSRF